MILTKECQAENNEIRGGAYAVIIHTVNFEGQFVCSFSEIAKRSVYCIGDIADVKYSSSPRCKHH